MSRIYFASPHGTAELKSMERFRIDKLLGDLLINSLEVHQHQRLDLHVLRHYLPRDIVSMEHAILQIRIGNVRSILGHSTWNMKLATGAAVGSDVVRFGTWIHGTCELHGYVKPEDFLYVRILIGCGLDSGLFREGMGWDAVSAIMQGKDPVVMSYSVTDRFDYTEANLHRLMTEEDTALQFDRDHFQVDELNGYQLMKKLEAERQSPTLVKIGPGCD